MKKYISIDIGGTAIKYGIVSENAEVLLKKEMKTEAQKGGPAILEKVIGIVEELKGEADAGVCISTAGMVDIEKGEIFYCFSCFFRVFVTHPFIAARLLYKK